MDMSHLPGVYFWVADCDDPSASGHMIKIGRAVDLLKRAKSVQTSCPYRMLQLWGFWHPDHGYVESEREMHETFKKHHHHGEWFCIPSLQWRLITERPDIMFPGAQFELLVNRGPLNRTYYGKIPPPQFGWALAEAVRRIEARAA